VIIADFSLVYILSSENLLLFSAEPRRYLKVKQGSGTKTALTTLFREMNTSRAFSFQIRSRFYFFKNVHFSFLNFVYAVTSTVFFISFGGFWKKLMKTLLV